MKNLPPGLLVYDLVRFLEDTNAPVRLAKLESPSCGAVPCRFAHIEFEKEQNAAEIIRRSQSNDLFFGSRQLVACIDTEIPTEWFGHPSVVYTNVDTATAYAETDFANTFSGSIA